MRNRIDKSNKTGFDYTARKLGVIGAIILATTCIAGGITLSAVRNENRTLTHALTQTVTGESKAQANKAGGEIVLTEEEIIVTQEA